MELTTLSIGILNLDLVDVVDVDLLGPGGLE